MATADAIRAQIAAETQASAQCDEELRQARQELDEARERQRLRRELDNKIALNLNKRAQLSYLRICRSETDEDVVGDHLPESTPRRPDSVARADKAGCRASHCVVNCNEDVLEGAIEWRLEGLSWLKDTLLQTGEPYVLSDSIEIGNHRFFLCYHPAKGEMGDHDQRASLALLHEEGSSYNGVTFRYTMCIKSKGRGYVQWGDSGSVCTEGEPAEYKLFGPDVCNGSSVPGGIFGMSHAQLLMSEWVEHDTMTAKVSLQVRPLCDFRERCTFSEVTELAVPDSSRNDRLLRLFESGAISDVLFIVQGEEIQAHSQILSALSDVFQKQFACGMQEAVSKRVVIDDCDPIVFKAFLRYLYCDSFSSLDAFVAEAASTESKGSDCNGCSRDGVVCRNAARLDRPTVLRQVLALSHKYQELRLQRWTERELCKGLSIEDVCSVLSQAHLYEAEALEQKCLDFIVANMNSVAKTAAFASLTQEWPQVSLKITLRLAGVCQDTSVVALENQENVRKRKRAE